MTDDNRSDLQSTAVPCAPPPLDKMNSQWRSSVSSVQALNPSLLLYISSPSATSRQMSPQTEIEISISLTAEPAATGDRGLQDLCQSTHVAPASSLSVASGFDRFKTCSIGSCSIAAVSSLLCHCTGNVTSLSADVSMSFPCRMSNYSALDKVERKVLRRAISGYAAVLYLSVSECFHQQPWLEARVNTALTLF